MISREIHNLTPYLILPLLMRNLIRHYTIGYQEIKHVVLQKVLKFSRFFLSFLHSWERNCKCKLQRYYSCVHLNPTNSCHVDLSGMSCLHLFHNGVKIFLNLQILWFCDFKRFYFFLRTEILKFKILWNRWGINFQKKILRKGFNPIVCSSKFESQIVLLGTMWWTYTFSS